MKDAKILYKLGDTFTSGQILFFIDMKNIEMDFK